MDVTTKGRLTGAKAVDFEEHKFVNLYVLVAVKNGVGEKTAKFKLQDLSRFSEVSKMVGKDCIFTGGLEENDQGQTFFAVSDITIESPKAR